MAREDPVETLRWRVQNCERTLDLLLLSRERIAAYRDSGMKTHLASLNDVSIAAVKRSLAALKRVLQIEDARQALAKRGRGRVGVRLTAAAQKRPFTPAVIVVPPESVNCIWSRNPR